MCAARRLHIARKKSPRPQIVAVSPSKLAKSRPRKPADSRRTAAPAGYLVQPFCWVRLVAATLHVAPSRRDEPARRGFHRDQVHCHRSGPRCCELGWSLLHLGDGVAKLVDQGTRRGSEASRPYFIVTNLAIDPENREFVSTIRGGRCTGCGCPELRRPDRCARSSASGGSDSCHLRSVASRR